MEEVGLSCPISGKRVNETVVRLIAAQVVIFVAISLFTGIYWINVVILFDFASRAFFGGTGSLFKVIAKELVRALKLRTKLTDEGPKNFAAKIGFIVLVFLVLAQILNLGAASWIIGGLISLFAILESVFAICVGCILYQQLSRFRSVDLS